MNIRQTLTALSIIGLSAIAAAAYQRHQRRFDWRDACVLIAGGSRGLGLELARMFASKGARLVLLGRDEKHLAKAAQDVENLGAEVVTLACDIRDPQQVTSAMDFVLGRMGRIDVLVNNAGIIQMGPLDHTDFDDFEAALNTHYRGPLHLIRAALPHMKAHGGGRIINIASIGGLIALPHLAPYCASKAALVGLSDAIRAELAADNIYVTTVCPGLMRTGSHYNALFKGKHRQEFAWFAISLSLPLASINSRRAAQRIVRAAQYGVPFLTFTPYARIAKASNALMPNLTGRLMQAVNRLLPKAEAAADRRRHTGWDSRSSLVPSWLTRSADRNVAPNNQLPTDVR